MNPTDHLKATLDAILAGESTAAAIFVHNPQSQLIAMTAIVAQSVLFSLIEALHPGTLKVASAPAAPQAPAPAPAPTVDGQQHAEIAILAPKRRPIPGQVS